MRNFRKILMIGFLLVIHIPFLRAQNSAPTSVNIRSSFTESIYIHTDQSLYFTGDYIWMKAYLLNSLDLTPSRLSRVIYIELLDSENHPVLQTKIASGEGTGNGSLFIPASLNSGNYALRAYTQWMRNSGERFFFHKTLRIINPFKPLPARDTTATDLDVQFLPEGGQMIDNLPGRMAFRVVDQSGKGILFRGLVVSDQGDTVAHFSPVRYGIGSFRFTPESKRSYQAIIKNVLDSVIAKKSLPPTRKSGLTLEVSSASDSWTVIIGSSGANTSPENIQLNLHRNGNVFLHEEHILRQELTEFTIAKEDHLPAGIIYLTISDKNGRPAVERALFKHPEKVLQLQLETDQEQYTTRSRVEVSLSSLLSSNNPVTGSYSATVYHLDSLQGKDPVSISNTLLLTSGLKGNIENPDYYFSDGEDVAEATENLLMTHGWSQYVPQPAADFIPEYRAQTLRAKIQPGTGDNGRNIIGIPVYLTIPGRHFKFQTAYSDSTGEVLFEIKELFGDQTVVLQTDPRIDSTLSIVLMNPFSENYSDITSVPFTLQKNLEHDLEQRSINMQMENIYFDTSRAHIYTPNLDTTAFYSPADHRYYLDDYTRFPSMLDVMKEYIQSVAVRKRKQDYHYMVYSEDIERLYEDNPLVLLDGLPVFSINDMIFYDPLKVEYMDIITHGYVIGPMSFPGVVSYSTYNGDFPGFELSENALVEDYSGLQWKRRYFSPSYESREAGTSRLPDRRTLLYWTPDLTTNTSGNTVFHFYTSDIPGNYWLSIQGTDLQGHISETSSIIQVTVPGSN